MIEEIEKVVIECVKLLGEDIESDMYHNPDKDSVLYGPNGGLDSINLVTLIADLEMEIEDNFGKQVTIATERAMSQRISPFRTVRSISNYIQELINAQDQ